MSGCPNCGAPLEPVRCSYCLTPHYEPPTYEGTPIVPHARYAHGWVDARELFAHSRVSLVDEDGVNKVVKLIPPFY